MADVQVVALGPDDWEVAREVRLRSLKDTPDAFWSTHDLEVDRPGEFWQELLAREGSQTFHARVDGRTVGCAVGAVHPEDDAVAALFAMWVDPEARGTGAGDALMEAVKQWARDRGFSTLRFDVEDRNERAQGFYARHGARRTGRTAIFPPPREHLSEHELEIDL